VTPQQWIQWIANQFGANLQMAKVNLEDRAQNHPCPYERALAAAALDFERALTRIRVTKEEQEARFSAPFNKLEDVHD
jgi:hypothetical protein